RFSDSSFTLPAMLIRAIAVASAALAGVVAFGFGGAHANSAVPTACELFGIEDARALLGNPGVIGRPPSGDRLGSSTTCIYGMPSTNEEATGPLSPVISVTGQEGPRRKFATYLGPETGNTDVTRKSVRVRYTRGHEHGQQIAWYWATRAGVVLVMYRNWHL